ncbi:MAG: PLP-dependent aminotransferase family protein [Gammaproteobacteria bacterium]|nr:PLP-dependent aminotransferase family protein [Gammaproteobacteria bacterium]
MINLSSLVYQLDRTATTPLFVQLTNGIRLLISSGDIAPDTQLPPSRSLSQELGLSRSTVTNAYEQLVAEGYIEGRQGSGFYTCPIGQIELNQPHKDSDTDYHSNQASSRRQTSSHPGFPDLRLFPFRQWGRCVSRVARLTPEALVSTDDNFGDIRLRQSIADYLHEWRGLNTSAEQIIITAGSIDALEMCIRTLGEANQYVGLEDPGYLPLRNIVESLGMKPLWLPMTDRGVEIPQEQIYQAMPRMSILTPSHQFPLGGAMTPLRRMQILQWAEKTRSWIIEDDYDSEFRYAGTPIQALAGFDKTDRTVYIGTFSKIFSVGLRLGFLVSPRALIGDFSSTLQRFGIKAGATSQRVLSTFMESGEFYRHVRRVRRIYGERRKFLIQEIQRELDDVVSFEDHAAGMQLLIKLPGDLCDVEISRAASLRGAVVSPLSSHYARADKQMGLLLGFCGFTEGEIKDNVATIADIIKSA